MAETKPDRMPGCDDAFLALRSYAAGSPRGALQPLDAAVAAASQNSGLAAHLEARLVASLRAEGTFVAREYICSKLALIGGKAAVPALADLLTDPQLATAARNALERILGHAPSAALRQALLKGADECRVGIIQSLGVRRDTGSVRLLASLLKSSNRELWAAAAAALGEIGSVKAARAVAEFFRAAPQGVKQEAANALLGCAGRLEAQGRGVEARDLLKMVAGADLPRHIKHAAEQALQRLN